MSRPQWPDSHQLLSDKPGAIHNHRWASRSGGSQTGSASRIRSRFTDVVPPPIAQGVRSGVKSSNAPSDPDKSSYFRMILEPAIGLEPMTC